MHFYDIILLLEKLTLFANEAKKVDECVYDVTVPRDVFVAYSSVDMNKVSELVDVLESEGLSCFVAIRNLQHGRNAVANYERHLQEAIDNCRCLVLVSSVISRTRSDARTKELPYIRKRDMERAPAQYRDDYAKIPTKYKKPRVEYLIENYKGMAAESYVKEFFAGNEYRYSPKEVAEAVFNILATPVELDNTNDELRQAIEDQNKRIEQIKNTNSNGVNLDNLLIRADRYYQEEDYENALDYYNKVLDIDPNNIQAIEGSKNAKSMRIIKKYFDYSGNTLTRRSGVRFEDNEIDNLIIPSNIETIGKDAFRDFEIKCITIPHSVTCMREFAFVTKSLKKVNYLGDLMSWCKIKFEGNHANPLFRGAELYIDNNLITDLNIPFGITSIGPDSFSGCSSIKSVTIPNGVTSIGSYAFGGCTALTSVSFPSSLKTIESNAFSECTALTSISLPNSLTHMNYAFFKCTSLTNVVIPNGVIEMNGAFYSCTSLTSAVVPDSVTQMNDAFHSCKSLKSVTISKRVEYLGSAFSGCVNLEEIIFRGITQLYVKDYYNYNVFKDGGTFVGCDKLRRITMPKKMRGFMGKNLKKWFGDRRKYISFTFTD